jgi:tetratricopeptide (TPR) repeat protein
VLPNPRTRRIATGIRRDVALLRGRVGEWTRLNTEFQALDQAAGASPSPVSDAFAVANVNLWIRRDTSRAVRGLLEAANQNSVARHEVLSAGIFFAQAGRTDLAREFLKRYEATADTAQHRADSPLISRLQAYLAIAEGRPAIAVAAIREGDMLADGPIDDCHVCSYLRLGDVFASLNQADSAIVWLEKYVETPHSSRSILVDPLNLTRVLRRLGELHASRGGRAKAIGYYERFVELWKNADPELQPQVTVIRRRLAQLKRTA